MRKFFVMTALATAAAFLLPLLLVRGDPLAARAKTAAVLSPTPASTATLSPSPEPSTPSPEPDGETFEPVGAVEVFAEVELEPTLRILDGGELRTVLLEDYVAGAVAAEMSPSFPEEARKAQAVAVRSLALYRCDHPKHGDAALCTSAGCCMAWTEPDAGAVAAARATEGEVATYGGEAIMAAFFSSSGGATRSAREVWGAEVPYLVGVPSPEGDRAPRGHGVGMSQYGAAAMAESGADYVEILRHYYTGAEVGRRKV